MLSKQMQRKYAVNSGQLATMGSLLMSLSPPDDRRASLSDNLSRFSLVVVEETDRRLRAIIIGAAAVMLIAAIAAFAALLAR